MISSYILLWPAPLCPIIIHFVQVLSYFEWSANGWQVMRLPRYHREHFQWQDQLFHTKLSVKEIKMVQNGMHLGYIYVLYSILCRLCTIISH